ncbi:hypothetical protein BKA14_001022 [Actinoplanes abujensis]|uniref:Uncharacterized protein n=1 Tax=Paractinoplanes abujensis TaxID=882441 RepID=A0A7W7CM97_9ACTN|nr:hypothetical protein [Actinoplanes abujensis]
MLAARRPPPPSLTSRLSTPPITHCQPRSPPAPQRRPSPTATLAHHPPLNAAHHPVPPSLTTRPSTPPITHCQPRSPPAPQRRPSPGATLAHQPPPAAAHRPHRTAPLIACRPPAITRVDNGRSRRVLPAAALSRISGADPGHTSLTCKRPAAQRGQADWRCRNWRAEDGARRRPHRRGPRRRVLCRARGASAGHGPRMPSTDRECPARTANAGRGARRVPPPVQACEAWNARRGARVPACEARDARRGARVQVCEARDASRGARVRRARRGAHD